MGEEVKDSDQMDAGCKSKTLTFATKRTEERPHRRLAVVVVCNCHACLRRSPYRPLVVVRPEAEPEPADKLGTVRWFEHSGMEAVGRIGAGGGVDGHLQRLRLFAMAVEMDRGIWIGGEGAGG